MHTRTDEIAAGIHRISTFVPDAGPDGFTFNQFLLRGAEPLLFHTGPRALFPAVSQAVARIVPLTSLRWITFGHFESDECGSMNQWLAAAPRSQVAHGAIGVMVSLTDLCDRPPRALQDGEVLDLGGKRLRYLYTPHCPHGWDAGVMYEESTGTLLSGDLFTQLGNDRVMTDGDILGPAILAEEMFQATSLNPEIPARIRALAELQPKKLALMHGPSFEGDGAAALLALADFYERRTQLA